MNKFDIFFISGRIAGHSRPSESTFHCLILLSDQPIVIYLDSSLFHNRGTKISAHERFLPRFYAPDAIPTTSNVLLTWQGHPVERVNLKRYTKCNISQLQISTLKVDYMILWYLSIKYILLDIFISSRNILGCDNMDIYINITRAERIFGNTGK
jgi:hypothetical protein